MIIYLFRYKTHAWSQKPEYNILQYSQMQYSLLQIIRSLNLLCWFLLWKKKKYSQSPSTSLKYKTIKIIVIIMICLLGLLWHRKQMPADLYCRDIHIASWYMAEPVSYLSWGCSVCI